MKKYSRFLALLLTIIMVLSFTACERRATSSGYWTGSDYVEGTDDSTESDTQSGTTSDKVQANTSGGNTSGGNTSGGNTSGGNKNPTTSSGNKVNRNENQWQIDQNVKIGGGSTSVTKGLNFGGETLRFLDWVDVHDAQTDATIKSFEQKYNCKIKADSINFEDYLTVLATSQASGKPYDIVKMSSVHSLQAAISNVIQPLEKYISSADLTTTVKKPGINWNISKKSAWGGHAYVIATNRPTFVTFMLYNKLLYSDYGLEDPMTLYKQGKWTFDKIYEQAKIVKNSNAGVHLYDDTITGVASYSGNGFYNISDNGLITFTGANTAYANAILEKRKFYNMCPLYGEVALNDNFVSGKCMLWVCESVKLPGYIPNFKNSAVLGKNLNNIGVVPIPTKSEFNNAYQPDALLVGYSSQTGGNAKAAVAYTILASNNHESWETCGIPAVEKNVDLLLGLYDKMDMKGTYSFHASNGNRLSEEIYGINAEIEGSGDIMKILEKYAPTVKSIIAYNLDQQ